MNIQIDQTEEVRCKAFICENFLNKIPSAKNVSFYSLFVKEYGTFTNMELINKVLKRITIEELYKRPV